MKRPIFIFVAAIAFGLFCFGIQAQPAQAAIAFVASTTAANGTSPAINTTGASLLVVVTTAFTASTTISDNMNNTWNELPVYGNATSSRYSGIFYAYNPSVSSTQTFTCSYTGGSFAYEGCMISAWSGTATTSAVLDIQNGSTTANNVASLGAGSITPASPGELIITGFAGSVCMSTSSFSISGGLSIFQATGGGCGNESVGYAADLLDSNASAIAPVWSWGSASAGDSAIIAAFKSATAPPGISSFSASPSFILSGASSTLLWNISNASSVAITPGSFSTSTLIASTTVNPTSTTTYTLTATNANGTTTATTSVTIDSIAPTTPTSVVITPTGTSTIYITWTSSTDTGGPGISGYNIFRCQGSCTPSVMIATSSSPSYSDSGLTASTTYTYAISAFDTLGLISATSSNFSGTTQAPPPWTNILSSNRAINWGNAGLPAIFPDGETTPNPWTPPTRTQCGSTVSPLGGGQDDVPQIVSALSACPAGQYVLLASGTFTIGSSLYMSPGYLSGHNNVSLRGSGPQSTKLEMGSSGFINIGAGSGGGTATLASSSNFSQGATSITVSGGTPPVNEPIWINQCDTGYSGSGCTVGTSTDNGGVWICGQQTNCSNQSADGGHIHEQQTVFVTSVTGDCSSSCTVTFTPGLYMQNWSYAQSPIISWNDPNYTAIGMGLEDVTLDFTSSSNNYGYFSINDAYASWARGDRFLGSGSSSCCTIGLSNFAKSLFSNNYTYDGNPLTGAAPDGLTIIHGSDSDVLIMNNLMQGGGISDIEGGGEDSGVVIAYNYARDNNTSQVYNGDSEHSASPNFILQEGNEFGQSEDDYTWGTHDFDTWFRNYISCYDPPYIGEAAPRGIDIDNYARFENAIGNAMGGVAGGCTAYQGIGTNQNIFGFGALDPLSSSTLMRWGNYDTVTGATRWCGNSGDPGWSTTCGSTSEVPLSLSSPNAAYSNPVPSTTTLPTSFFMNISPHPSGGTGLSWWKVCTNWSSFPTNCAGTQTSPFPAIGPDVSGGQNIDGYAYNVPAAIAYNSLPIDPSYQNSYSVTSSSWSGGTETLTVSGLPASNLHTMGGFQLSGVSAPCIPSGGVSYTGRSDNEVLMTGSSATSISYALASNPGSCSGSTMKWPDVREFDDDVYETDTASSSSTPTINSFSASSTSITLGSSSLLSWNVSNASSVLISGNNLNLSTSTASGTVSVTPNATGTLIYTLSANNVNGTSTATTSIIVSASATTSTSTPPQSLVATPHNVSISLSWSAPTSTGGSGLTEYLLYDRFTGSSTFALYATTSPSVTTSSVTSLTNGQSYDFEVIAQNGVGTSTPSNIASSTPYTIPNPPTSPSASPGNAEATISFTPGSNGGSTILYYTAVSSPSNISASSTGSPIVVSGLTNGQAYTFTITATNIAGTSSNSSSTNSVTPINTYPAISSFSASYADIQPGVSSTLSWSITNASSASINQGIGTVSSSSGSHVVSPTSTTIYTLTATNGNGSSSAQISITVDGTPPSTPTSVSANAVSASEIDLSWASSTDNVGVAGYNIYQDNVFLASTTNLSYQNTGLSASTQYSYYLTAFDLAGNLSASSTVVSATTQSAPSGGGGGGGGSSGGGGGGGGYYPILTPTTPTSSSTISTAGMTVPQLESLLASLEAELQTLEAEAGGGSSYSFTRNLTLGSQGPDVKALQHYLNTHGFPVNATLGYAGSLGYETEHFGTATQQALSLFQKAEGITPDSGFFGPKTRAWVEGHS